jgi:hypothetical protein
VAAGALIALAVALASILVAEPASADGSPLTPPAQTQALPTVALPLCTAITPYNDETPKSADLGWSGKPHALYNTGGWAEEFVPMIPCVTSQDGYGSISERTLVSPVTGAASGAQAKLTITNILTCYDPDTGSQSTYTETGVGASAPDAPRTESTSGVPSATTQGQCPDVVSIKQIVAAYNAPDPAATGYQSTWTPAKWTQTGDDGGWTPATNVNQFAPPGVELPIICTVDTSGTDIVTVWNNMFASLVSLPACLFIPVGWDRAGEIPATFSSGAVGQLTTAFKASVPDGLACGPVATVPVFGHDIPLNTCAADVAPDLVKTVVGWVMVLGICALVVRRFFWTVGSKS